MFRQKTNWILVIAIGFVAFLFLVCKEKKPGQIAKVDTTDSSRAYILRDGDRRRVVTEIRCGEAGSPPCYYLLPDSSEADSLDADSLKVEVSVDSSMSDSGKVIIKYNIEVIFESPFVQ